MSHIDELSKRMADTGESLERSRSTVSRGVLPSGVATAFNSPHQAPMKSARSSRFARKFFGFTLLFMLICGILLFVSMQTFQRSVNTEKIELRIVGNSFVDSGEETTYQVVLLNKNAASLEEARLTLSYPQQSDGGSDSIKTLSRDLKNIGIGVERIEEFPLSLFGISGSQVPLTVRLEYRVAGSRATFFKETELPLTISSSPIDIVLDAPESITKNQNFTSSIRLVSHSDKTIPILGVRVEYPNGFEFQGVTPEPNVGKYYWEFENVKPGVPITISFTGAVDGLANEAVSLRVYSGVPAEGKSNGLIDTVFASRVHTYAVTDSFIISEVYAQGSTEDSVSVKAGLRTVSGVVRMVNRQEQVFQNIEVRLRYGGRMLEGGLAEASGSFVDSGKGEIVWNRQTNNDLGAISPGARFDLPYSIELPAGVAFGQTGTLELSVFGEDASGVKQGVSNVDTLSLVQSAAITLLQDTLYESGSYKNSGSVPPIEDQKTTYTIRWKVPSVGANISNVIVTTQLPVNVDWTEKATASFSFNQTTKMVTWNAGNLLANDEDGIVGEFQVRITPNTAQVGNTPSLTGQVLVSAVDSTTDAKLSATKPAHTTKLKGDSKSDNGIVVGKE